MQLVLISIASLSLLVPILAQPQRSWKLDGPGWNPGQQEDSPVKWSCVADHT